MKKPLKISLTVLLATVFVFGLYLYKLHALSIEGNKIFEYRCTNVNPHLIGYKNSFLEMADFFNDPERNADVDVGASFEDYNAGLRAYVAEEDKWLAMQKSFINRWDFKLIEPWYIQKAAEYNRKMYEEYRDDAQYLIDTYNAGGATDELLEKHTEARNRRDKYSQLYFDFFKEASEIQDWRKLFATVPIPKGCNKENLTIPNTSGAIDWEGITSLPTPTISSEK